MVTNICCMRNRTRIQRVGTLVKARAWYAVVRVATREVRGVRMRAMETLRTLAIFLILYVFSARGANVVVANGALSPPFHALASSHHRFARFPPQYARVNRIGEDATGMCDHMKKRF